MVPRKCADAREVRQTRKKVIHARIAVIPVTGSVTEKFEVVSNDPARPRVVLILRATIVKME